MIHITHILLAHSSPNAVFCVVLCEGPSVLDVFNTLLRHLRLSVESAHDERNFQEAIVNTVGQ